MSESLYALLAEPVDRIPDPGTVRTSAVETIDDDHSNVALLEMDARAIAPRARVPDPGTVMTKAVETVDEDALMHLPLLDHDEPKPPTKPNPGTMITLTEETVDEDESSALVLLR